MFLLVLLLAFVQSVAAFHCVLCCSVEINANKGMVDKLDRCKVNQNLSICGYGKKGAAMLASTTARSILVHKSAAMASSMEMSNVTTETRTTRCMQWFG